MAPPPPGPTLCALLELIRSDKQRSERSSYYLGDYSSTALLTREGDRFQLFPLSNAVLGVSPEDDRMPDIGEMLFEARGTDELVGKLLGVWTVDYGKLLASDERLRAQITGVDRGRLLIELRQRWDGGLTLGDAAQVIDGKRALDGRHASAVATVAQALGATVVWSCQRVQVSHRVVIASFGKHGVTASLIQALASRLRQSSAVVRDLLHTPPPIAICAKDEATAEAIRQALAHHGAEAESRQDVSGDG